jgi:hypothetical protein
MYFFTDLRPFAPWITTARLGSYKTAAAIVGCMRRKLACWSDLTLSTEDDDARGAHAAVTGLERCQQTHSGRNACCLVQSEHFRSQGGFLSEPGAP